MKTSLVLNFALLLISFSIPVIVADNWTVGVPNTTKHVCRSKCGNLSVPYPFGIMSGSACSMNPSFDIICDESSDPPKAFLGPLSGHIMVSGIYDTTIHIKNQPARTCYNNGETTAVGDSGMNFSGTPFSFSDENKLTAVGCNDAAFILKSPNNNLRVSGVNQSIASCVAICSEYWYPSNGFCSGSGCCQASIPKGVQSIYYHMETLRRCDDEHENISACSYSFLAEPDTSGRIPLQLLARIPGKSISQPWLLLDPVWNQNDISAFFTFYICKGDFRERERESGVMCSSSINAPHHVFSLYYCQI